MQFLKSHDNDFDTARAFLIVSMVFTHIYEMFYIPDYNRNYTFFVTIGFVLLAGFTNSIRYSNKVYERHSKYFMRYFKRFTKLLVLFIVTNIIVMAILPEKYILLTQLSPVKIIQCALLGSKSNIFAFDVLVPIAFTILLSWGLLSIASDKWAFITAVCLISLSALGGRVAKGYLNSYFISMTLVGLTGSAVGKLISTLNWDDFMKKMIKTYMTEITAILTILYFLALIFLTKKGVHLPWFINFIPTIIILFFIYLVSRKMNLNNYRPIKFITEPLSKHTLFAYLFHILIINILFNIIPKGSLNSIACLFLGIFVLLVTLGMCYLIEYINGESTLAKRTYSMLFK